MKDTCVREPGIIRNAVGRITETGWPSIPAHQWPNARAELLETIGDQIKYDSIVKEMFEKHGTERHGYVPYAHYYLRGNVLGSALNAAIQEKIKDPDTGPNIDICDVGGGDGTFLATVTAPFRGPAAAIDTKGKSIRNTLTSLVNFGLSEETLGIIDSTSDTPIELPPDNFYEAFDIITAQNSVYHWSRYPELTTLNLTKMLRVNGILIVTTPRKLTEVKNERGFSMDTYLQQNPYLRILASNQDALADGTMTALIKDF